MPITGHKNIKIVVSLALINDADEILLSKRPKNKHLAGFWEFPGGKLENNEKKLERFIFYWCKVANVPSRASISTQSLAYSCTTFFLLGLSG